MVQVEMYHVASRGEIPFDLDGRPRKDLQRHFGEELQRLKQAGFYWIGLSKQGAQEALKFCREGTFLIRDSSSPFYMFTLSARVNTTVVHCRILCSKGRFALENTEEFSNRLLFFESLPYLLEHYTKHKFDIEFPEGAKWSVALQQPLRRNCLSLKELCRLNINRLGSKVDRSVLTEDVNAYLSRYPYNL